MSRLVWHTIGEYKHRAFSHYDCAEYLVVEDKKVVIEPYYTIVNAGEKYKTVPIFSVYINEKLHETYDTLDQAKLQCNNIEYKKRVLQTCKEDNSIDRRPGDGVWSYWLETGSCLSSYDLRIIADELDRRNKVDEDAHTSGT
jgi:hypothetical protein